MALEQPIFFLSSWLGGLSACQLAAGVSAEGTDAWDRAMATDLGGKHVIREASPASSPKAAKLCFLCVSMYMCLRV